MLVDYVPINSVEKGVLFQLVGTTATTTHSLVNISLKDVSNKCHCPQ